MRNTSTVDTENRDFYRKSQCDSPPAFNSNESKSVTCTFNKKSQPKAVNSFSPSEPATSAGPGRCALSMHNKSDVKS